MVTFRLVIVFFQSSHGGASQWESQTGERKCISYVILSQPPTSTSPLTSIPPLTPFPPSHLSTQPLDSLRVSHWPRNPTLAET